jgi:ubiquinone/menaquinone biosynthesis C-methylase UbiE
MADLPIVQEDGYIHGFSRAEQVRLVRQAEILAPGVIGGLGLCGSERVLELGCGVGAELKLLARRWPGLVLTGVDRSPSHLAAARDLLAEELHAGRVSLVEADVRALPFPDDSFDRVLTIWMLEHVADPASVLGEAARVLHPRGRAVLTEVDNASFRFDPPLEPIAAWWERFSAWQQRAGGDPYVGRKLEGLLRTLGWRDVHAEWFPNVSSRHAPARRGELLAYLQELLLSGAETLMREGVVTDADRESLLGAFGEAASDPAITFQYLAFRVSARPGKPET